MGENMLREHSTANKLQNRCNAGRLGGMAEYDIGSKLRELRLARKLTLRIVASEMGFSTALLSQIENNNISPPLQTLWKLSRFYEVTMGSLFAERDEGKRFQVVRNGDRTKLNDIGTVRGNPECGPRERRCARMFGGRMFSSVVTLSEPVRNDSLCRFQDESFIFVLAGVLELSLGNDSILLEAGDSIYFDASTLQGMSPKTAAGCAILAVGTVR